MALCVGMRADAYHVEAKILKCSKIYFQGVTTCHDEVVECTCATLGVCHGIREQFVTDA